jgi:hypothetical protein
MSLRANHLAKSKRVSCIFTPLWLIFAGLIIPCNAQDLEPRRWSHLPTGINFAGAGYAYTTGDIAFDPVLLIEDAELEMHTTAFRYIRTFEWFEKSARFDFLQAYQDAEWNGLLDGLPASARRSGWSDTVLRFSMDLLGAPPLQGKEFADYRASVADSETIVGVGLAVHLPTGNYLDDKLLNLGTNRFTFRPQVGVVHNRGKWSLETTASAWIFTENDDFFGGNLLEQDPLYTVEGHLSYTFRPGLWLGAGIGYGFGAESTLNGIGKDDQKGNLAWGVNLGCPITRNFGLKIEYIGMRTQERTGADLDTVIAGFSFML